MISLFKILQMTLTKFYHKMKIHVLLLNTCSDHNQYLGYIFQLNE